MLSVLGSTERNIFIRSILDLLFRIYPETDKPSTFSAFYSKPTYKKTKQSLHTQDALDKHQKENTIPSDAITCDDHEAN